MVRVQLIKSQFNVIVNYLRCFAFFTHVIISFSLAGMMTGCSPSDVNADTTVTHSSSVEQVTNDKVTHVQVKAPLNFAPTVEAARNGLWSGGSPPINKRASGIDTYYKMSEGSNPDRLLVTLQFERVKADDAYMSFKLLDGAEVSAMQPLKWRLKSNAISEVTFEVKIAETVSYLALYTFQNGKGASRAFRLEKTRP